MLDGVLPSSEAPRTAFDAGCCPRFGLSGIDEQSGTEDAGQILSTNSSDMSNDPEGVGEC